jgi:hypothetical protein
VGVKLIGIFQDKTKIDFLFNLIQSASTNGFVKRNAVLTLNQLDYWDDTRKDLMKDLLNDNYFEVRAATLEYLSSQLPSREYDEFKKLIQRKLKRSSIEEKVACLKIIGKFGTKEELIHLHHFYLSSNSILREELLEMLLSLYRRKQLTGDEVRDQIEKILKTSNNLSPEFRLKSLINTIYKELEQT